MPYPVRMAVAAGCSALLALLLPVLLPGLCRAACTESRTVLYLPVPEGGQTESIYLPLAEAWNKQDTYRMALERAPGRGGSYALSRLLLEKRPECGLAAMQIPSLYFLARAPGRMFREEEITPVAILAYVPHALWVDEKSPLHTVDDLVALARGSTTGRGTVPVIGGTGRYTDQHLANLALDRALGIRSVYYPLTGTTEAIAHAAKGAIHATWGYALEPGGMPGMRPLAVAASQRSPTLPGIPTFREQGVDFASGSHFGIAMAHAAAEAGKSLGARISRLMADPSVQSAYTAIGASLLLIGPEDLSDFLTLQSGEANRLLREYPLVQGINRATAP